jgi:hypothetical protein
LIRGWGFNCTCSLCSDPEAMKISDRQRNRIQEILDVLDDPKHHTHAHVRSALAEVEHLVDKEGMTAQIGDFYSIVADLYFTMGDMKLARDYGELALELVRHYAGYDNDRSEQAVGFLDKLTEAERAKR